MKRKSSFTRAIIGTIGSLRFAALLMTLLLISMAFATVFESRHGTEQALRLFYRSPWFAILLALIAVNVFAALVARYPFSKRQIGFVITHVSILVILAGAATTNIWGINGHIEVIEGQTVRAFDAADEQSLTIAGQADGTHSTIDLDRSVFGGFVEVDTPSAPVLKLGNARVVVTRYIPNSVATGEVVDDDPHTNPAIEVSFGNGVTSDNAWVFVNTMARVGHVVVAFRLVSDSAEFNRLTGSATQTQPASEGVIRVEYQGATFRIPLEKALASTVPLGETGVMVHVLRYLPHATVGRDKKITSASTRPVNPAVEVELVGPEGREKRLAFARFPEFGSMHKIEHAIKGLKLSFISLTNTEPTAPIEVLGGPEGEMVVRFSVLPGKTVIAKVKTGEAIDTPWAGHTFTVRRRFDHARVRRSVVPEDPAGGSRVPAVHVKVDVGDSSHQLWLQEGRHELVNADGTTFVLSYGNKEIPLGYDLTLDRFQIGYYPGGTRPRSFESHITYVNPITGRSQSRVISMNHPAKCGSYTLYQTGYNQEGKRAVSFLGVSWDPGQRIVFIGYIALLLGMVLIVITHIVNRRRRHERLQLQSKRKDTA